MMNDIGETLRNPLTTEEVTFVQSASQTNGQRTVVEILLGAKGAGPPLHYHTACAETFEVLEGELTLRVGHDIMRLRAGQRATAAPYQRHTFWSEHDGPTRFRGTIEPGHPDVENCFRIAFGLAKDGLVNGRGVPRRLSHLVILATMSQSNLSGVLGLLDPVFRRLARTRRCRKVQRALVERYCPPP